MSPATIEYDDRYGRRAICRKCGTSLVMSRYVIRAGEAPDSGKKRLTSKQKREMIRKGFQDRRPFEYVVENGFEHDSDQEDVQIVKNAGLSPTVTRGSE
jgi:hypothetical protein